MVRHPRVATSCTERMMTRSLSRRAFLKRAAAGLAGAQIASFKRTFRTASGVLLGEPDADEVTDSDIEQQQIVKRNRS